MNLAQPVARLGNFQHAERKIQDLTPAVPSTVARVVEPTRYPSYSLFARACRDGLSVVYPFKKQNFSDPHGWKFQPGYPPSYLGFGRMRALLAVHDALSFEPRRALEVASGGGGLAASVAATGCEVTANDLLEEQLTTTLSEFVGGERIRVVGGSMFDLAPDAFGTFDLVVACEVIEHVAHPGDLLRHLKRFLAPGGRILLTTPNGSHFRNRLPTLREAGDARELERRQFKPDADGHLFLLTPGELCELADAAGLTVARLNLWGTPPLSGHAGCRVVSGRFSVWPAYLAELMCQRLSLKMRERLCVAVSAILT